MNANPLLQIILYRIKDLTTSGCFALKLIGIRFQIPIWYVHFYTKLYSDDIILFDSKPTSLLTILFSYEIENNVLILKFIMHFFCFLHGVCATLFY